MKLAVIGTGYVGLVTGACLADIGHDVICVDIDAEKISRLKRGEIPIFEPGLEQTVHHNAQAGRLRFTTDFQEAVPEANVVFIAVGTPAKANGTADLQYVFSAADEIARHLKRYTIIVNKSTVPVGTARTVAERIRTLYKSEFDIAACPEFLREGSAVDDFFAPDRIIIGVDNDRTSDVLLDVFKLIKGQKVITAIESAELIKYASNAFLATKISFINEIAQICERTGADIEEVAYGVGLDHRIGPKFLKAGIGWGGSCFPKDVSALHQMAGDSGYDTRLLQAVIEVNRNQRSHFIERIQKYFHGALSGKRLAVFGLAFKDNTDDVRESAAIEVIQKLLSLDASIIAFDYQAQTAAKRVLPEHVEFADDAYAAAKGANAVLIVTEWKEFKELDWVKIKKMLKQPVVFDGRNLLKSQMMTELGFHYFAVGRSMGI